MITEIHKRGLNMDLLNSFAGRLSEILSYTFLSIEIWRIVAAGLIIAIVFTVRKIPAVSITALLKKITSRTKEITDDELITAFDPPLKLLFLTVGMYLSVRILGFKVTDDSFTGHIIRSLIIFAVFWAVYRASGIITRIFERFTKKTHTELDDLLVPFVNKGIKVIVAVVMISVIAKEWKYDLGALLTGLGLGGLALALAAQETLANLFGGLAIMLDKPFNVGDYIQFDGLEGTVEDIGFRSTRIRTPDLTIVTVPNSTIAKANVTNCSRRDRRRVKFCLPVKYGTNAEILETLLRRTREMLENHPEVHDTPVYVYLDAYGQNGFELLVIFYAKSAAYQDFLAIKEDVNLKLMHIMDELGIEVAIPAANIYLANRPDTID